MNKSIQREEIRKKLKLLNPAYCQTADSMITASILKLPEYQNASCIFCYISVGREVNTRPVIYDAWASGKRVAVPRCTGKGIMELFEIHSYNDLEDGSYHIPEPGNSCTPVTASEVGFAIIPCLACDRSKNRLGHGDGYYDRYLENASFPVAALCREKLLLDQVCIESHDQTVDMVITEAAIYQ